MLHEPELSSGIIEVNVTTRFGEYRVDLDLTIDAATGEQFIIVPSHLTGSVDVSNEAYEAIEYIVNLLHNDGYDALRNERPLEVEDEVFIAHIRLRSLEVA